MAYRTAFACLIFAAIYQPSLEDSAMAEIPALEAEVRESADRLHQQLIARRRDIHQHPELGDQETRTAKLVAKHLRGLGLQVRTGVARTGVVGILSGAATGPTVALRADMDALPVKEPEGLPFASKATGMLHGNSVPVMHACGHDAHTAILMTTAEVLTGLKDRLRGRVVFIFQPAEEGSSIVTRGSGGTWGAKLMLEEGLFDELQPDAVFSLHVMPGPWGQISYRSGATTAASDSLKIRVIGEQGHGGMPWNTIDAITTSALIISGLQTVVSRKADLSASPAVVTVGTIHGGHQDNIVAGEVEMTGTIRSYDEAVREQIRKDIQLTAEKISESAGAKAEVAITKNYDVTFNNEELTKAMAPVLQRAADGNVAEAPPAGASEDFSFFARAAPGLYMFLGITPPEQDPANAAPNHSPNFFIDEEALVVGVRTLGFLTVNFLYENPKLGEKKPVAPTFIYEDALPATS